MRYKYRQIEHIIQSHRRIVNNAYARPHEKNIKATRYAWRFCNGAPKRRRSEQRERNCDCCALRQSRLRQRTVLSHVVHCTDTTCLVRLLRPLRTVSANATRLPLPLLAVSNRYRIRWGASEKCREHHGILNGAQKATAVEHINQNSFLLIIFARTVIASSYDISSYNKIDVFSL